MEGEETPAKDAEASVNMEQIRQRRLAYFQTSEKVQASVTSTKLKVDKQGAPRKSSESISLKKDRNRVSAKTSEFHIIVKEDTENSSLRESNQSENYTNFSSSKPSQSMEKSETAGQKRGGTFSNMSDDYTNQSARVPHSRSDVNMTPNISHNIPHFSSHSNDSDGQRWASSADIKWSEIERAQRPVRKSGDKEVESLFNGRKSTSACEIPALSLKESIDIDSVSVFKSKADFDDLGLSTHRPESTTSSSIANFGDKRQMMRQRSMSSESLLLGSKVEEIKTLLSEEKYREFVEKSERELSELHKAMDSRGASLNWSGGNKANERLSRADGSAPRNIPTPPPQPPSPQPTGPIKTGPSPRRRLRSSSPQMVSKTLQDIARSKEVREAGLSRNYEQVVIPRNITFSADEIYRQAYGGDSSASYDLRKSSCSVGSSHQDTSTLFWNSITPRQMAGGMSPTSPHNATLYQPHFMPVSGGGSVPPPQQPMSVGSSGTYYYPQMGTAVSMAGGGAGQFVYSRQPPNMFVPMSPSASPQSPEAYFYQVHPLSQSMPGFHTPSSPMQSPGGLPWQYGLSAMGQDFQGHGQQAQDALWNQFGPRVQQNSQHYGQGWQQHSHPGLIHTSHRPNRVVGKGIVGDVDKSQGDRSSAEHADATLRLHHEHQHHGQDKQSYSRSTSQPSGDYPTSSVEHYFSSLGMPPPSYPPPPYHLHQPPNSHHPLSSRQTSNQGQQVYRQVSDMQNSSDTLLLSESHSYDDMTTVTKTSWATGTSIGAGGITDRLEQLGVDPVVVQNIRHRADTTAADEEALEAMRNLVRICPECQAVNKEYMTWCLQCGGVLIGIDPIPAKDLKKKNREKKGSLDSSSKIRKTSSQGSLDGAVQTDTKQSGSQESPRVGKTVPIEVQHYHSKEHSNPCASVSFKAQNQNTQEPLLEFEEFIEEETMYSSIKEQDQDSSETGEIPDRMSPPDVRPEANVVIEEMIETKESPESGRGASASSSPCRRNINREFSEDVGELIQNTHEVSDNKDSGRPSSGEGAESRKPQVSSQLPLEDVPQRSEKEINEICEVINDPIIRGFIKSYLQKKPQDSTPYLTQPLPVKHKNHAHGRASERQSCDTTKATKKQVPRAFSLHLEGSGDHNSSLTSKPAAGWKVETPKKKGHKKPVKKGHEAIDVEIFAIEEAKILRSSGTGANVVPKLKLVHSSDEDDSSSEKTNSIQGAASIGHGLSSDTSSPQDYHSPVNYSSEMQTVTAGQTGKEEETNMVPHQSHGPEPAQHSHPSTELANSNFLYLKEAVEKNRKTDPPDGKKTGQTRPKPQTRPSATSKVRTSIEAPPPSRRWMRSSIAWSSYHPRELHTRSSVKLQSGGNGGQTKQSTGNFRTSRSTDSLVTPAPPEMSPSQRPRPASADQSNVNRRGANRGRLASVGKGQRPHSAGIYSTAQFREAGSAAAAGDHCLSDQGQSGPTCGSKGVVESPRSQDTDIEGRPIHRLAIQEDTLPLIPAGPDTALKIYDRCFGKTPRDEMEQESKWLFLPDELWLHVFTYLPQLDLFHAMLSCKQLYRVALDPQLWKCVTVRKKSLKNEWLGEIGRRHPVSLAMVQCHGDQLSESALRELFREVAPKLKELNFSRCSKGKMIGDEILLHTSTYCRHLTHVDASWCHVTDKGLTALAGCCHRLESLCLNGCQQITDESLKTVVEKHGTSLRVLELFGCFSLSPASFRNLAEYCTFLLTLNIGQCYKISDSNMVTLSASLSRVETLDLRGCKKLGDNSIRKIVRSCRRLRHLILANCPLLSNASVVEIATYSTDIRSLDVCGCSNISDSSIQTLVKNCFRLTSIDISSTSCSHKSVLMLADASRYLESAKFNFLTDVHEQSLAKLIKNCKRLNTVHLYGCNVRDGAALRKYNRFLNIEM